MSLSSKVTTIKTVKQIDELVDTGTDTPVWQRYRLKIMSISRQVSEGDLMLPAASSEPKTVTKFYKCEIKHP